MQVVGDLHAQSERERRALDAAHAHAHDAARRAFGHARDQEIFRAIITLASRAETALAGACGSACRSPRREWRLRRPGLPPLVGRFQFAACRSFSLAISSFRAPTALHSR